MLKATVVVAQRFCSQLVCGYGREKNEFFVAAFAASFDSPAQKRRDAQNAFAKPLRCCRKRYAQRLTHKNIEKGEVL